MVIYIDTIATIIFGVGSLLFLYKVKTRTKKPLLKLLSLNPKENLNSIELTSGELILAIISFILPLALLANSYGLI